MELPLPLGEGWGEGEITRAVYMIGGQSTFLVR